MTTQTNYGDGTGNPASGPVRYPAIPTPIGGGESNPTPESVKKLETERLAVATLALSQQGEDYLKGWEGSKSTPDGQKLFYYDDDSDYCTVGWGHLVNGRQSCAALGIKGFPKRYNYKMGDENRFQWISADKAQEIFKQDVRQKAEDLIKKDVKVPLFQHEFDALCVLAFNVGRLSVVAPKLMKLLNQGDYANAPNEIMDINKSNGVIMPGLNLRRKRDYDIFSKQIYNWSH